MICPYCNNEVPFGTTAYPSCNGAIPNNSSIGIPASPTTTSISTTYAWILAILPIFADEIVGNLALLAKHSMDETGLGVIGLTVLLLYLAANCYVLYKEEKLLVEARCRDEMLVFIRLGYIFAPVYLCARAAKIDKNWTYAIVGLLFGIEWWWDWIF